MDNLAIIYTVVLDVVTLEFPFLHSDTQPVPFFLFLHFYATKKNTPVQPIG